MIMCCLINKIRNTTNKQHEQSQPSIKIRDSKLVTDHNDEKSMETTIHQTIVKFDELSIVDGIDEIIAQIVEIDQMILEDENDNNYNKTNTKIKHHLSIVRDKLKKTKMSCDLTMNEVKSKDTSISQQTSDKCIQVDSDCVTYNNHDEKNNLQHR